MQTSRALTALTVATLAVTLLPSAPAHACGAMLFEQHESRPGGMSDQEIFVGAMRDETLMVVSAGFAASDTREFAFLLPIPAVPAQVEDRAPAIFQVLQHGTSPRVFIETLTEGGGDDGGCGCGSADKAGALGDGGRSTDVEVRDRGETETWEYVVVGGGGEDASVAEWLNAEGFTAPAAMADSIDAYVADGWLFFAARVKPTAGAGVLAPLQMHFPAVTAAELVVPIGISAESLAPAGQLGITLYLWSVQPLAPKNYALVNAADLQITATSPTESDYETKFEAAAAEGSGQFVVEYADAFTAGNFDLWQTSATDAGVALDGDPTSFRDTLAGLVEGSTSGQLVRLRTRLTPAQLQDITFEASAQPTTSNEHYVVYSSGGSSEAGLFAGGLFALLSLLAVWRGRQR